MIVFARVVRLQRFALDRGGKLLACRHDQAVHDRQATQLIYPFGNGSGTGGAASLPGGRGGGGGPRSGVTTGGLAFGIAPPGVKGTKIFVGSSSTSGAAFKSLVYSTRKRASPALSAAHSNRNVIWAPG